MKRKIRILIGNSQKAISDVLLDTIDWLGNGQYELVATSTERAEQMLEYVRSQEFDLCIVILNNLSYPPEYHRPSYGPSMAVADYRAKFTDMASQFVAELKRDSRLPVIAMAGEGATACSSADYYFSLPYPAPEFMEAVKNCLSVEEGKSIGAMPTYSEQEQDDLKLRVSRAEETVKRPFYRTFVRDEIPVKTPDETIWVKNKKSIWKEPLIWVFLAFNSVWAWFCINIILTSHEVSWFMGILRAIAMFWTMGLPAAILYIREVSEAGEPINGSSFFSLTLLQAPFFGLIGAGGAAWVLALFAWFCQSLFGIKPFSH